MKKLLSSVTAAAMVVGIAAGCSSGGGGGASNAVTGSVSGNKIDVKSGIYLPSVSLGTNGTTITYGMLSNDPNACDNITAGTISGNAKYVELIFANITTIFNAATTPGAYPVTQPPFSANEGNVSFGDVVTYDDTCNCTDCTNQGGQLVPAQLTSGTLQVTKVSADAFTGHGSGIGVDTGDAIGVNFNLTPCPGLAALFVSGTNSGLSCGQPL